MFEDFSLLEEESRSADVNISPLIDMVFILLIFFVITTNFNRQTGIEVSKPKASSAVEQGQKSLLVGVTREGAVHVHGRQTSLERLRELVLMEMEKRPDLTVVIIADRDASVGKAVEVMDRCIDAGVKNVSVAAERIDK